MENKPGFRLLIALAILTITAVGLCVFGWLRHNDPWPDALYLALKSTDGGEAYEHLARSGEEIVRAGAESHDNWMLEFGRFLGAFAAPLAFSVLFASLFNKNLACTIARWKRREHIVVVGKSIFADRLSEHDGVTIVHMRGSDDEVRKKGDTIRLPFDGANLKALKAGGAHRALSIVVAPEDDAHAIDLGLEVQQLLKDAKVKNAQVTVRLHDFWLAERLYDTPGARQLRAISEPCLAARFIVRCHPPFLLARDLGHTRVHALLIGDHDWLEAVMGEIILSACTRRLGKPIFSFICTEPDDFRTRLLQRYPAILDQGDLYVHTAHPVGDIDTFAQDWTKIIAPAPVTAVYSLFCKGARGMSNAQAFIQRTYDIEDFHAPVFVMSGWSRAFMPDDSDKEHRPVPGCKLDARQIVAFGDMADLASASGVLSDTFDIAARSFHEAYAKVANPNMPAATAWHLTSEEYRVSNRRAVSHMYAKLFDAGFDLRAWMESHDIWTDWPRMAAGETLYRDKKDLHDLMVLEHDRWIADRCMNGWRNGEERVNELKVHNRMVPFDELPPEIQDYDRISIQALSDLLKGSEETANSGIRRLQPAKKAAG